MVTLTYDDLDRISAALFFLAEDEEELEEQNHAIQTMRKIDAVMLVTEGIEPKPPFGIICGKE